MKKIYVDSCVFISYITNEMNLSGKLKGEHYFDFFEYFFNQTYKMVISTWVIREVKKYFDSKGINFNIEVFENMIQELKSINNIIILRYNEDDRKEANELDSSNYPDALHVILALKCNCALLTTENLSDFLKYDDLLEILHPKEL